MLATHLLKNPSAPSALSLPVLRNAFDWLFSLLAIKLSVETTSTLFYCRGNRRVGKLIHLSISKIWILWVWVIQSQQKQNFTFCPGKSRENFPNFFQNFPGLINKIQGLSRTEKKSRTFPGCGNPDHSNKYFLTISSTTSIRILEASE